ncbi:hypothetical protein Moror_3510 [Moniliophthora roreri MCA 2997]|uniref:Uncharacterized protein n=1 Tax=Moniliophthora roreri (strain MCA 2997) TaxID=1381753 RepID=V2WPE5_MONRO|nr:hypothetical protein Moror_3510 [Moniliophthora roreri MCA 2997]
MVHLLIVRRSAFFLSDCKRDDESQSQLSAVRRITAQSQGQQVASYSTRLSRSSQKLRHLENPFFQRGNVGAFR